MYTVPGTSGNQGLVIRLTNRLGAGSFGIGGESALAASGQPRTAARAMAVFVRIVPPVVVVGATLGMLDEPPMTARFIWLSCPVRETASVRVLVVEDEVRMADVIRRSLTREGYAADVAADGESALWMAAAVDYDAVLLDVMLPGRLGFEACRSLRERGVWSPVLMLTARDAVEDRVAGLDSGADDYLVKPFALA